MLVLVIGAGVAAQVPSAFTSIAESDLTSGRQIKGLVALDVGGTPVNKRFVIRMPAAAKAAARQVPVWNGSLVIGAHGGSGGSNFDRAGNVIGTDEAALDDVIGRHALANGFAYASFDREGAVSARDGLGLTYQFAEIATATDPKIRAYADAVGTPVEARRLWPYTGAGAVAAAARPPTATEDATGKLQVPTLEVAGNWDDLVIRELRAYRERANPRASHRLYQVDGVWHMSSDDDGVMSFQYLATSRMKLDPDVANAMGEGPTYLPTVREAFDHLIRWVEAGVAAPPSQTVTPGIMIKR